MTVQITDEQIAAMENGMKAMEALKSDITPKLNKLDTFDAKKFDDIQKDLVKAMDASEQVKSLKAAQEEFEKKSATLEEKQKQLEAALNRPVVATTPEAKAKEIAAVGTKLFNQFARKADENRVPLEQFVGNAQLDDAERKALTVNSNPNGGYLTTPEFGGIISTFVYETSPLRQLATVTEVGTDAYEVLTDNDQAGWGWVGETQARPDTYTPQIGFIRIEVNEMYAMPPVSQKMLDDAKIDVEAWVAMKVASVFARGEASAFISGNGVNKPLGLLTPASGTDVGFAAGSANQLRQRDQPDLRRPGGLTEQPEGAVPSQRQVPDAALDHDGGQHHRRHPEPPDLQYGLCEEQRPGREHHGPGNPLRQRHARAGHQRAGRGLRRLQAGVPDR